MLNEPYMEGFYTKNSKYISNTLALRPPQHEGLEIFARLCDVLSLSKGADLAQELAAVRQLCPTLTSFEREFPSVCFALATGIGKTRLMGACIAYLHYEKGVRNFFVMAPNLTIYQKLKADFGDPSDDKYVFRGLDRFAAPPRIVDGDNYNAFRQSAFGANDVVINVFNISKLNADSKARDGAPPRIKRLNEVLGESYFSYLQSLPDLCIFMDESHHYHADRSFDVINELRPILGVEMTATPQIQRGAKKAPFQNVIYEYSLAHALNDGLYVKVPAVITRRDFHPEEYPPDQLDREKLNDGLRLHEDIKSRLDVYARAHGKPTVKPFVLVVARDTEHSRQLREYLTSDEFFHGGYRGKVLEINSAQRGAEKDENIQRLLSLERPENEIEIVIHVNMLKEGWDVTNLYTIVPLRTSASETLTEQTIGRGLRLPFGRRTGEAELDRLSIVSHDKYSAIVELANDPNSLVRRVYCIDEVAGEATEGRDTVELPPAYDAITRDEGLVEQLALSFFRDAPAAGGARAPEQARQVAKFVADCAARSVKDLNRQVTTFDAVKTRETRELLERGVVSAAVREFAGLGLRAEDVAPAARRAVQVCVQALTDRVIPIPQAVVQPFAEVKQGFRSFELDTRDMNWRPGSEVLMGTELREAGETFELDPDYHTQDHGDTPENEIAARIIQHDDVDYAAAADLIYSLIGDARRHFLTYLTQEEAETLMRARQRTIADIIYRQMKDHSYREEPSFQAREMRPFSRIEPSYGSKFQSDEIYPLSASVPPGEVRGKVFGGFGKACHTLYKFDSDPERIFAAVLERDRDVLKWMRPAPRQFNIYYGPGGCSRYEPDFVVETPEGIFMVEVKSAGELHSASVLEKGRAAAAYCRAASRWNAGHGGKPWSYALISHEEIRPNSSFLFLMKNRVPPEQLELELPR